MNLASIIPPTPSDVADWSDVAACQERMIEAVQALAALAPEVGLARHILEYDSDRKKQALARAMAAPLAGGSSAAKAESEARNDAVYAKELDTLARQHTAAEQTISRHDVLKIKWETSRSLLSMQRESVKRL